MKYIVVVLLSILSTLVSADDLAKIAGKYKYEQYNLTYRDGRVSHLKDLGARSVAIEFNSDSTIVMDMTMLDGSVVSAKAKITEIKIDGNKGFDVEQWPDMYYPVRKDFSFHDDVFEYEIKFESKGDLIRYGSVERAVLRKL